MGKKTSRRTSRLKPSKGIEEHETPGLSPSRSRFWLAAFFVAALTLLVYLPALKNDFVGWDDHIFITENKHIMSLDMDFLKWSFANILDMWAPLKWISHAIDYKIWGLNPLGHHLSSIILHSMNTFFVVMLVAWGFETVKPQLLSSPAQGEDIRFWRKTFIASVMTGLLFGLHPLRVESVVWISERKDVLYVLFTLFSLIFYLKHVKEKRGYFYILSILCFIMALMSKAMAVTLPFVLIILDIYPLKRIKLSSFRSQRNVLIEKIPFIGLSIALFFIQIAVYKEMGAIRSLAKTSMPDRIIVSFKALWFYLVKMLWPSNLAPLHAYPSKISLLDLQYLGPFILVIAISISCIYLWRKGRCVWLAVWSYFVITLSPVLGFIHTGNNYAAERYTYMPSIGPFLLIGLGISMVWEKSYLNKDGIFFLRRRFIIFTVFLMLSLMSALTIKQTAIWRNSITLWTRQINIYPNNTFGYQGRGKAYENSGDYQKALRDLDIAIKYDDNNAEALKVRANAYVKLGDYQRAVMDLNKAVEIKPQSAEAYGNRCGIYIELEDYRKAIKDCSKALEINPQDAIAYNNRGLAFNISGEFKKAITDYSQAIAINPEDPGFYRNRGTVYLKTGKNHEAMEDFKTAARLGDKKLQELFKKNTEAIP